MKAAATAAIVPLLTFFAGPAAADWSGTGKLGGVVTRGNTETKTVSAIVDVTNTLEQWTYKFGGTILRTVTDEVTSADRWELRAETNYSFTPRAFTFGTLRYENDAFTDYAYQATGAGGFGYRFVMLDRTKLDATVGAGARRAGADPGRLGQDGCVGKPRLLGMARPRLGPVQTFQHRHLSKLPNGYVDGPLTARQIHNKRMAPIDATIKLPSQP